MRGRRLRSPLPRGCGRGVGGCAREGMRCPPGGIRSSVRGEDQQQVLVGAAREECGGREARAAGCNGDRARRGARAERHQQDRRTRVPGGLIGRRAGDHEDVGRERLRGDRGGIAAQHREAARHSEARRGVCKQSARPFGAFVEILEDRAGSSACHVWAGRLSSRAKGRPASASSASSSMKTPCEIQLEQMGKLGGEAERRRRGRAFAHPHDDAPVARIGGRAHASLPLPSGRSAASRRIAANWRSRSSTRRLTLASA